MTRVALVTGAGSGIGRGIADALHARGMTVIAAGRTRAKLDAAAMGRPGWENAEVDVADAAQVDALVADISARHGGLDLLVNNAGVQQLLDFAADEPPSADAIAREVAINLTGLMQVTAACLPLLRRRPRATLMHVSSGLAYVPLVAAPVYSATKAAVHSFTISLRRQLAGTGVRVVELIPPLVDTDLHRDMTEKPPGTMQLDAFVRAAMKGLDAGRPEIAIGLARPPRTGSRIAPGFFLNVVNKVRR